ncbi:MAG TPA: phosphatase PAP2 family protein [Anaerolineaceae bacterium]|nr:phosphatase PAP2 family protein [Anaerolineaceae bacterium]
MFWENLSQINVLFQSIGDWLFIPMRFFSFLGDEEFYLFIMPAIYWCFDSGLGLRLGMLLMISNGVNGIFKYLFQGPRPFWVNDKVIAYIHETSFGVPSGHSQNAVAIWGYFAAIVKKSWLRWLFIAIFVLIGLSRIYLGAHFILDVVIGWLIGGILVFLFIFVEKKYSQRIVLWTKGKKIGIAVLFSLFMLIIPILLVTMNQNWQFSPVYLENVNRVFEGNTPQPFSLDGILTASGAWLGLIVGVVLVSDKIPLGKITSSLNKKIVRFIIGLIGVMILWAGLRLVFPSDIAFLSEFLRFVRYFLIGIWISGGAPFLFRRLNL